ncbi:MFS transporter [Vibrio sp. T11.5]|uniref:MFS transporter n=1 Tax=Vibrio sp. T11.5 TaxID=2998836 RepID=UPI0022CDA43F|nr:MFS transporter [Vibrio sp. T11.5]MDA0116494.1 MFS transporter [Vibrio sp. T11.5]
MDNVSTSNSSEKEHKPLLLLYFSLSCFARTATGAAIVGILILSSEKGIPNHQMGILAACLSAPHLLGPIWGRWLDIANDPRKLIVVAACIYSTFMAITTFWFQQLTLPVLILFLIACGSSAPYLMGGISGLLNTLFSTSSLMRRKAHAWDVCSYAVGGTLGPMLVAGLTEISDTQSAMITIAFFPLISALLILKLPKSEPNNLSPAAVPSVAMVARQIITNGPLTRTMYLTVATSFSLAALPVCAISLAEDWGQAQSSSATLIALYGVGNLVGSVCLIRFPTLKEPQQIMTLSAIGVSGGLFLVSLATVYEFGLSAYFICGVANALFFAASLAARVDYSPRESSSQVFMWIAALKIAAVSVGSTFAGFMADESPYQSILASFFITFGFAVMSDIHRRFTESNRN